MKNDFNIIEPSMCPSVISCKLINSYLDDNSDIDYNLFINNLIVNTQQLANNRNIINRLKNKIILLEIDNISIEQSNNTILVEMSKIEHSIK